MSAIASVVVGISGSIWASSLVKVTITTMIALAAVRLARRRRASVRHVLLASAFAILLVLPVAAMVAPAVRWSMPLESVEPITSSGAVGIDDAVSTAASSAEVVGNAPVTGRLPTMSWSSMALSMWCAGAILFVAPVLTGLWQVRALRRSAVPWPQGQSILDELTRESATWRPVDVLVHQQVSGPMTCGILRPAIVMPVDAAQWLADDLSRALIHELEHVRRGDWLTQCLSRVVCAGYWCHPLVWIAQRQLTLEAERACDDAVLDASSRQTTAPTAYADQLVALAQRLSAASRDFEVADRRHGYLAMANLHDLTSRVAAVLDARQRRGRAGRPSIALAVVSTSLILAAISPLRIVAAQTTIASTRSATSPKFDVVSVKPCQAPELPPGARGAGPRGPSPSPGRLHLDCVPLVGSNGLIRAAYGTFASGIYNAHLNPSATPVEGGPSWVGSDRFTIDAKAQGTPSVEMMRGPMMQAVLEDRFQLKLHRDARQIPVYELTIAKGGSKLRPFDGSCTPVDFTRGDIPAQLEAPGSCPIAMRDTRVDAPGQTIRDFITFVLVLMDWPVIDKTGLTARFDIRLDFSRDEGLAPADNSATLAAAVQQLGLKLVSAKGPGEALVIDHVERPSPNDPSPASAVPARAAGAGPLHR